MSFGGTNGSGKIATSSDVALNSLANGQALLYNSTTQKWTNGVVSGSIATRTATSATTLASNDNVLFVDPTSAAFTVTLPTAAGFTGRFTVTSTGSSANVVTIATINSETIDGAASVTVGTQTSGATFKSVDLISDGTNWRVV